MENWLSEISGQGRLSTLIAGLFLMFHITVLEDLVFQIQMSVLCMDDSGFGAIDKVVVKYYGNNNQVRLEGLNATSKKLVDKLAIYINKDSKQSAQ